MILIRRVIDEVPRFTRRSFGSYRIRGESLDSSVSSTSTHGIHVFHCRVSPVSPSLNYDCLLYKYEGLVFCITKNFSSFLLCLSIYLARAV